MPAPDPSFGLCKLILRLLRIINCALHLLCNSMHLLPPWIKGPNRRWKYSLFQQEKTDVFFKDSSRLKKSEVIRTMIEVILPLAHPPSYMFTSACTHTGRKLAKRPNNNKRKEKKKNMRTVPRQRLRLL